jgi:hypothetical protein
MAYRTIIGTANSLVEIGLREGLGRRYISRMIRFAFLAPSVIEEIVAGHQSPDITAQWDLWMSLQVIFLPLGTNEPNV